MVCADARQVFRELEIGTGKPEPALRAATPHHLFDMLALGERASAGGWAARAAQACRAIQGRGRVPVLVGGSGLWFRALREGLSAEPPHDPAIRARLQAALATEGVEALHRRLAAVDPATASRLGPRDRQRITRALEVFEASGRSLAWWHAQGVEGGLAGAWRVVELTASAAWLGPRIEARTRWMFDAGLVEETQALLEAGHGPALRALRAIGYDEAMARLAGTLDRAGAEAATTRRTRQLAKRQRTWFRHQLDAVRLPAEGATVDALCAAALADA